VVKLELAGESFDYGFTELRGIYLGSGGSAGQEQCVRMVLRARFFQSFS
jgi:hypothetical protein